MKNEEKESKKQENIKTIIQLLTKTSAKKVAEILIFVKNYLSQ